MTKLYTLPKRRDRKALQYLEDLQERLREDPERNLSDSRSAQLYARALVITALLGEDERALFQEVYRAHRDGGERLEARRAGAGQEQLRAILEEIMTGGEPVRRLADYMMETMEEESWQPIQEELKQGRFKPENFVWWAFDFD